MTAAPDPRPKALWRRWRLAFALLAVAWLAVTLWNRVKPLPAGLHATGPMVATSTQSMRFLTDVTSANHYGDVQHDRQIHAATLELVLHARDFLVLDYFLFNGQGGPAGRLDYGDGLEPVSAELIEAIRELKRAQPALPVLVITDPINDYYRGDAPPALVRLSQAGVDVVVTRLDGLRDSNPVWSSAWRMLGGSLLPACCEGRLGNPLDGSGPPIRLGALLRLPNFKANHRKVAITGDGAGSLVGIVSSGNPHDASSAHSNVALQFAGEALRPLLASELAVARFSGWRNAALDAFATPATTPTTGAALAGIVTEGAIRDVVVARFDAAQPGDAIDIAMFYLSERRVIDALLAASRRGVAVRVLLDPNKDAFGFEKSGIPNRQVASELVTASEGAVHLRWYRTHGEQFHTKIAMVRGNGRLWFTLGSANFTRRNIGDYNLEANVVVDMPADDPLASRIGQWFETLWTNHPGGTEYSADAEVYAEPGLPRYWLYRFMEASGMSTF